MPEYHVTVVGNSSTYVYDDFGEAAKVVLARTMGGATVQLDVTVVDEDDARQWSGAAGAEQFQEDPEASVFERYVVSASCQGRVP